MHRYALPLSDVRASRQQSETYSIFNGKLRPLGSRQPTIITKTAIRTKGDKLKMKCVCVCESACALAKKGDDEKFVCSSQYQNNISNDRSPIVYPLIFNFFPIYKNFSWVNSLQCVPSCGQVRANLRLNRIFFM